MTDRHSKFMLKFFGLLLSAEGIVALILAVPVSILLLAFAYHLVRG